MAKEEKKTAKDERQERWEALLESYAKYNPTKYAAKKAAGQFDKIPDDFK